jgi:DNA-binding NtrC family response regulator
LLRFLEHGDRQGGPDRPQSAGHIRVITATSQNLLERMATGGFREDLYYRLNVIHLVIPALRERPEDVAPLITHFLETFSAARQMPRPVLSEEALAKLIAYAWPGNAAELANVMERLVLHGVTPVSPADLPIAIARGPLRSTPSLAGRSTAYGRYARTEDGATSFGPVRSSRSTDRRLLRRHH